MFFKRILSSLLIIFSFAVCQPLLAQSGEEEGSDARLWGGYADDIRDTTGLGEDDPRHIAANIINIILGFLGIIALVLIIYAGFKWMTAAGNETQVGDAKKLLVAAVIGLIIILSAFALSSFVLDAVYRATTS